MTLKLQGIIRNCIDFTEKLDYYLIVNNKHIQLYERTFKGYALIHLPKSLIFVDIYTGETYINGTFIQSHSCDYDECIPGPIGPTGATGISGPTGPPGGGLGLFIVPFSSDKNGVELTSTNGAMITFGQSNIIPNLQDPINIPSGLGSYSFMLTRNVKLKNIYLYFTINRQINLGNTTIDALGSLYYSSDTNTSFTKIQGSEVQLTPSLSGNVLLGAIATGSLNDLSIPITANSRVMLVVNLKVQGSLTISVNACISGGITLSNED